MPLRPHGASTRRGWTTWDMAAGNGNIVAEAATRIFADLADPQTIDAACDTSRKDGLWRAIEKAGFTLAWVPEELGGSGADLADGFALIDAVGRHALPVPLAETLLAGLTLARAGIATPPGAMTVAPARPRDRIAVNGDGTLSGRATKVPFAADARHIVVVAGDDSRIALVRAGDCRIGGGENLASEPANSVMFDRVKPAQIARAEDGFDADALMMFGATLRSVQIAGALQAVLAMSVRYANERVAFERPIGKFQAVQQNLARLAGETAAALAAAGSAADALARADTPEDGLLLEAAAAKIRTGEAAAEGAAIAHQVHGAIGFTKEHILHRFTLRMLAWRDDFGSESYWADRLGNLVAARGADQFWPLLAAR